MNPPLVRTVALCVPTGLRGGPFVRRPRGTPVVQGEGEVPGLGHADSSYREHKALLSSLVGRQRAMVTSNSYQRMTVKKYEKSELKISNS